MIGEFEDNRVILDKYEFIREDNFMTEDAQDGGMMRKSDVPAPASVDVEQVSENERLVAAVHKILRGEGVLEAKLPRFGDITTRIVTVVAADGTLINLNEKIPGPDETILPYSITTHLIDKEKRQQQSVGASLFQRGDPWLVEAKKDTYDSDEKFKRDLNKWEDSGGEGVLGVLPLSSPYMNPADVAGLAERLETAKVDPAMTNKAMHYIEEHFGAVKIAGVNSTPEQPALSPAKKA